MKTFRRLLLCLVALAAAGGRAEELDLAAVPADCPEPPRQELTDERAAIARHWGEFLEHKAEFRRLFAGTKAGTPRAAEAEQRKGELQAEADAIVDEADRFNEKIAQLRKTLPPTDSVVDPRRFVTPSEYDYARRLRTELQRRHARVEGQLAKLKMLGEGLRRDSREFEQLRQQAQIDCLEDVLMKIPAGTCFEGLAAQGLFSREEAKALADGYNALKLLVEAQQAVSAERDTEKLQKVLATRNELRGLLMDRAVEKLDPKARLWLTAIEGVFDAAAQNLAPDPSKPKPRALEPLGQALVAIGVAVYPPVALVEITGTVLEKSLQQHVLAEPLDALNEALSRNLDARRLYESRLETVNYQLAAVQETIGRYEAVH